MPINCVICGASKYPDLMASSDIGRWYNME